MSYEGHVQVLCPEGHYFTYDVYEEPEEWDWKCPYCKKPAALWNQVDDTNGDAVGRVEIEQVDPPRCWACACSTIVPAKYRVKPTSDSTKPKLKPPTEPLATSQKEEAPTPTSEDLKEVRDV